MSHDDDHSRPAGIGLAFAGIGVSIFAIISQIVDIIFRTAATGISPIRSKIPNADVTVGGRN